MKTLKVALIGVGGRGEGVYRVAMNHRKDLEFVAVCDTVKKYCDYIADEMVGHGRARPMQFSDYKRCIDESKPDVIIIATAWDTHLKIATYAMERGIAVGCEVGGAYTVDELWDLVACYERTKTPFMMLENCCYGRLELLALQMKRLGLLGKIVHCEGGYKHDCRTMVDKWVHEGHYRVMDYMQRNCENYPTHELGPIGNLLDINRGNRYVSLYSVASGAFGLKEYMQNKELKDYLTVFEWQNRDDGLCEERLSALKNAEIKQGDIITTLLKCANGETVTITLDTSLPRYYSRGFTVQGTKGMITEENNSVYLDGDGHGDWKEQYNNVEQYYEKYEHPVWENYRPGSAGHGGMDALVFNAFFDALQKGEEMPIDVYDAVTWMVVSVLSEQSIKTGQAVEFPDFTKGKWRTRKNTFAL